MKKEDQAKLLSMKSSAFYLWLWKHKKLSPAQKRTLGRWFELHKNEPKSDKNTLFGQGA